jgi:hypothetical protein
VGSCGLLQFLKQNGFQIIRVGIHFAGGNFFVGGSLKTKFANAKAIFGAYGWSKHATSHGACFIELTKSGRRIKGRARLIVGEISKALFCLLSLVQQPISRITGEVLRQPGNRFPRPLPHAVGTFRRALSQIRKSFPEPGSIELIYGEDSNAALRATRTADEPLTAFMGGIGERRIYYLNQCLISWH